MQCPDCKQLRHEGDCNIFHEPDCGTDREAKMVEATPGVFCDPCIAPIVKALNEAGLPTIASCCGHGHRPPTIALRDGREVFVARSFDEARRMDRLFQTDINGHANSAAA